MVWTKENPTRSGWYWYREIGVSTVSCLPYLGYSQPLRVINGYVC